MKNTVRHISIHHGNGGIRMKALIDDIFLHAFDNDFLNNQSDSAILPVTGKNIAFTTDSFVVDPLFFPGGNIGKLAVCGTLNDLAVSGARPIYLSAGFIIEEGFNIRTLERIVHSMAKEAALSGVKIVTGDTKVVNYGKCDKIFINTSGIGLIDDKHLSIGSGIRVKSGDKILLNGPPGEHGMAIMRARGIFNFKSNLKSDCVSLSPLIRSMLKASGRVGFLRDATRGGIATVLNEIAGKCNVGLEIDETCLPVNTDVRVMCELLGLDSLYIANEGKVIAVVDASDADDVLKVMRKVKTGKNAAIIGEVTSDHKGKTVLKTSAGGKRILDELIGDQLPRIC